MDIYITTICEVNEKKLLERLKKEGVEIKCDNIRKTLELAISIDVQNALKQHVEDDILTIVLSTVPAYPYIENSTQCTINHMSDTYLIRGDNKLCKDLRAKIGSQARVLAS